MTHQTPLDIHVRFIPERGLIVEVDGVELRTADMEHRAVLWGVVSHIVNRLQENEPSEDLRTIATQMTEYFRQARAAPGNEGTAECEVPPPETYECCICLEHDSFENRWMQLTSCGHIFHTECIIQWRNPTCPLCRTGYGMR